MDLNFTEGELFEEVIVKDGSIVGTGKNDVLVHKDPAAMWK